MKRTVKYLIEIYRIHKEDEIIFVRDNNKEIIKVSECSNELLNEEVLSDSLSTGEPPVFYMSSL